MNAALQKTLLNLVREEWRQLSPSRRPWGVWIRCYPPKDRNDEHFYTALWPQNVWFLDQTGYHTRDIFAWRRFQVVVLDQLWCQRGFLKEPVAVFGQRHEIGLAAFAMYQDSSDVYLEVVWGRTFGRGYRLGCKEDGTVVHEQNLWVA